MLDWPPLDLGNMTATAVLGWYAWHTASKTVPGLIDVFRSELAALRDESHAEREAMRAQLAEERRLRHADHMAIVEALHELSGRLGGSSATHHSREEQTQG